MQGIFKANNPFNTFRLFIYGIVLKLFWFAHPRDPISSTMDGILYRILFPHIIGLKQSYPVIYICLIYSFLITQALIFNRFIVNQRLLQKANYLPGMSYILLTSLLSSWNQLSPLLIINTLLVWAFAKMNKLYNATDPLAMIFNIGMIIGICSLIYVPAIIFSLLIISALVVTRPFHIREWVVSVIGILTPYYFLLYQVFFTNNNLKNFKFPFLSPIIPRFNITTLDFILIILLLFIFIAGLYYVILHLNKQVVQVRKSWSLLFYYLIITICVSFFYSGKSPHTALMVLIPLSAFYAGFFFYNKHRIILIITHWLLIGFIIYTGYFIN